METLLVWADILHDEITGIVWYCAKNSGFFYQIVFARVMKMVSFHNFDHLRKIVFHNLNLKMMEINNKVHFLKSYFLIMRNKSTNINIPYRYANWM